MGTPPPTHTHTHTAPPPPPSSRTLAQKKCCRPLCNPATPVFRPHNNVHFFALAEPASEKVRGSQSEVLYNLVHLGANSEGKMTTTPILHLTHSLFLLFCILSGWGPLTLPRNQSPLSLILRLLHSEGNRWLRPRLHPSWPRPGSAGAGAAPVPVWAGPGSTRVEPPTCTLIWDLLKTTTLWGVNNESAHVHRFALALVLKGITERH